MNLMQDRTEEIKRELSELNQTLKMSVQKAIRIGQLLTEQRGYLGHGLFLPWLDANFEMGQRNAYRYMNLFEHQGKVANLANLTEAYKQIETIEAQEKQSKEERDRSLISEFRKTGIKPQGWTPKHDKAVKDTDDHLANIKEQRLKDEADREQRAKEYQAQQEPPCHYKLDGGISSEALKLAADSFITKSQERQSWKEKIRLSDGGKDDAFMDAIVDYLETLPNDNRRIEACNNIIKICRNISVELQKVAA